MSKPNGFVLPFVLVLVSSSVLSHKSAVFGSPLLDQTRPDPLNHFKAYHGDFDIGNRHYWASAAFTGVHGYGVAGVWMLMGIGFGGYIILKYCTPTSSPLDTHSHSSYYFLFFLVLIFTLLALIATGLTMAANQITVHRTRKLKETLFGAGDAVQQTIGRVTIGLQDMEILLRPYKHRTCELLNETTRQLDKGSQEIHGFVDKNRHTSNQAVETLYIANLVVVSVNMAFFIAALVLLLLHWQPGFVLIILFCWILTTLSWMMTGFDFFIHTFMEDTCLAFEEFNNNPQNSSLRSMLSCADSSAADKILVKIGQNVHKIISELNSKIREIHELLLLTGKDDLLGVSEICDPFSSGPGYRYVPENCPKDAIAIGDIPNVLSRFTCFKQNSTRSCKANARFLPESAYNKAWAYSHSIQDLINVFPDMQNLARCSSVKEAITNIVLQRCKPLKTSVIMLWASMLSLSIVMVILTLFLVAKAYQDRGRAFSRCSITPNSS
ncbi:hypothetical protein LguiB_009361 [Lonicera macranthoides]